MDKLKEAIILAGQLVGRTKQDHIVFKCGKGYDVCNPKNQKEPAVRYLKYTKKAIIIQDEKGKEIDKIVLEVDIKESKSSGSKT